MTRKNIPKKSRIQKSKHKKRKNTTRKKKGGSDTEDITNMVDDSPHPTYNNIESFERDRKELYYFNLLLLVDSIIPNIILNADFGIRPFNNELQAEIYEEIKEFTPEALDAHINEIHTLLRSNNPLLPELPEGYEDLPWKEKFLWIKAEREKIGAYTEKQQTGGVTGKKKKKIRKTKRKKKKNTKSKKKRGAGPACSRPQVNEDNQSDYSDGSNPDYPIIAEQMPDNEPLPPGAQRIPSVPYPSASAERVPDVPIASTEISLDTDNTPDLQARVYNSTLHNTKLNSGAVNWLYNFIDDSDTIGEDWPGEREVKDALRNYVYHVNYFDPFSDQAHGNPNKIGDYQELYIQVYNLIGAWNKYDGNIEHLLDALRSDPDAEIGF